MTKLRDDLIDWVMVYSKVDTVVQEKPYTAVIMKFEIEDSIDKSSFISFYGIGFSKVKWPDEWNDEFGYNLACKKAAAKIVKQIIETKDYISLLEEIR